MWPPLPCHCAVSLRLQPFVDGPGISESIFRKLAGGAGSVYAMATWTRSCHITPNTDRWDALEPMRNSRWLACDFRLPNTCPLHIHHYPLDRNSLASCKQG